MNRIFVVLLLALLFSGCASTGNSNAVAYALLAYEGPIKPPSEVAIIQWPKLRPSEGWLRITHIDGVRLTGRLREIHVLPGEHEIATGFSITEDKVGRYSYGVTVEKTFKAGRIYVVDYERIGPELIRFHARETPAVSTSNQAPSRAETCNFTNGCGEAPEVSYFPESLEKTPTSQLCRIVIGPGTPGFKSSNMQKVYIDNERVKYGFMGMPASGKYVYLAPGSHTVRLQLANNDPYHRSRKNLDQDGNFGLFWFDYNGEFTCKAGESRHVIAHTNLKRTSN